MANTITIIRMILGPVLAAILLTEIPNKELYAFVIFVMVAFSDALDGYVARKFDEVTKLGRLLDPLADKFLVIPALLILIKFDLIPTWVAVIIILREVFIALFRYIFHAKNKGTFSPSWLAQKKTAFQYFAIGFMLCYLILPQQKVLSHAGIVLLYMAMILTVYSGVEYIVKYSRAMKDK